MFWGLEEYFSRINGVIDVVSGYANGKVETTNYKLIHDTDHAETIHVTYDADKISYASYCCITLESLIHFLWINKEMTQEDNIVRVIYYVDEADSAIIQQVMKEKRTILW